MKPKQIKFKSQLLPKQRSADIHLPNWICIGTKSKQGLSEEYNRRVDDTTKLQAEVFVLGALAAIAVKASMERCESCQLLCWPRDDRKDGSLPRSLSTSPLVPRLLILTQPACWCWNPAMITSRASLIVFKTSVWLILSHEIMSDLNKTFLGISFCIFLRSESLLMKANSSF